MSGSAPRSVTLERCKAITSNFEGLVIATPAPRTIVDCEFGDCYRAEESNGAPHAVYRNVLYRDCNYVELGFGTSIGQSPMYTHYFPSRETGLEPPQVLLDNCTFRNVSVFYCGSWVKGTIRTIDSLVSFSTATYCGLQDVDLDIDAWIDQLASGSPLVINGPPNLTTQVTGAPAGTFVQPPANVKLRLRCHRTEYAKAQGNQWLATSWGGYLDASCRIEILSGEISRDYAPQSSNNPPVSFPFASFANPVNTNAGGYPVSLWHGNMTTSGQFTPRATHCATGCNAEATYDLTLPTAPSGGSSYGYAEWQRIQIHKRNAIGALRFVKGASASFIVPQDRVLDNDRDWIEFQWNKWRGSWEETAFHSSA